MQKKSPEAYRILGWRGAHAHLLLLMQPLLRLRFLSAPVVVPGTQARRSNPAHLAMSCVSCPVARIFLRAVAFDGNPHRPAFGIARITGMGCFFGRIQICFGA
jgi:hypothetical protein